MTTRPRAIAATRSHGTSEAVAPIAATVFLWASAFVAIRIAVPHYGPVALTVARLLVASIAFGIAIPFMRVRLPARADLGRLALAGLLGMSGYQLLLNLGEEVVTAGTASIIIATAPAITALLARRFLSERLSSGQAIGLPVALAGVILVTVGSGQRMRLEPAAILVIAAAVAHAAYFVVMKPLLDVYHPFEATAWATWLGTAVAAPLIVTLPEAIASSPIPAHLAVLHLGVGASALGFLAWSMVLRRVDATVAAGYLYLVPPATVAMGWLLLDELPTAVAMIGGGLALVGVAVAEYGTRWSTGTTVNTRPVRSEDLPRLLELNNQAVPHVNHLEAAHIHHLIAEASLARVAIKGGKVVGFSIALTSGADYDSENYRWFERHAHGTCYIDRVVVAPQHRGLGVGRRLYQDMIDHATRLGIAQLGCEVNLQPRNPESMQFHLRHGFRPVGQQHTEAGTKLVALLARPVHLGRSRPHRRRRRSSTRKLRTDRRHGVPAQPNSRHHHRSLLGRHSPPRNMTPLPVSRECNV